MHLFLCQTAPHSGISWITVFVVVVILVGVVILGVVILWRCCYSKSTSFSDAVLQSFQQQSSSDSTNPPECQTDEEQTRSGSMITSCVPS